MAHLSCSEVEKLRTWKQERARIASLSRSRTPDDPELVAARQNLTALRLEKFVIDVVPALRSEQRERIAELLRGTGSVA